MLKRLRADEAQKARNILANASSQLQAFQFMKAKFERQIEKEEKSAATTASLSLSAAKTKPTLASLIQIQGQKQSA